MVANSREALPNLVVGNEGDFDIGELVFGKDNPVMFLPHIPYHVDTYVVQVLAIVLGVLSMRPFHKTSTEVIREFGKAGWSQDQTRRYTSIEKDVPCKGVSPS